MTGQPWRGPFKVEGRRGAWKIVNRRGEVERYGFVERATAARVAGVLNAAAPCRDYRPDHNGECLNCDEPADAHA